MAEFLWGEKYTNLRLMEIQIWHQPAMLWGMLGIGAVASASTSV